MNMPTDHALLNGRPCLLAELPALLRTAAGADGDGLCCEVPPRAAAAQQSLWREGFRYEGVNRATGCLRFSRLPGDQALPREPLSYLDGEWLPRADARVRVEDRGFVFSDGVYEVVRYYNGRAFTMREHEERMRFSMRSLKIELDWKAHPLAAISDELLAVNGWPDAHVYWQVTRGAAHRKHYFPRPAVAPTVTIFAYPEGPLKQDGARSMTAITREDVRWKHCEIKSISLLSNILDSEAAQAAGVGTAILVRQGIVTECPARSLFLVERGGLTSYPLDGTVLDSITRRVVIELARGAGIPVREEGPALARLYAAEEAFVVGTTTEVTAVTEVDGRRIGNGQVGALTQRLAGLFVERVRRECGIAG